MCNFYTDCKALSFLKALIYCNVLCCVCYAGETSCELTKTEVSTEADSNDITEHPRDDKPRPYVRTVCDKRFIRFVRHSRIHKGEKPYRCQWCDKVFSQCENLNTHMRVHMGDKPYKCHLCDKAFSESGTLTNHMRVHTGEKPYKCSLCNKSFTSSSNLRSHTRHIHMNSRPYDCRYCG